MKKLISFIMLALICAIAASALPFVPTTDPNLASTNWYYIKTEGLYVVGSNSMAYPSSSQSSSSNYQWCFVGDNNSGYRLYNRQYAKYLGISTYMYPEGYQELAQYKERSGNTFYLYYYDAAFNMHTYMYYDAEQNDLTAFGSVNDFPVGCFEAVLAEEGAILPPTPAWTRYDANGVGYGFIEGGASSVQNEKIENLCDGNAETKYYGTINNCWITMQASQEVAVQQYSVVTANDSRSYYDRSLRSWELQGSNDNVNWVLIDEQKNYPMPFDDQVEVVISVNDNRKFKYFKFLCTGGVAQNSTVQLSEVWINKEPHGSWNLVSTQDHGCGYPQVSKLQCSKCHIYKNDLLGPASQHNYVDGKCSVCGIYEDETILLYNGQMLTPYYVKALHANRNSDSTWPSAPDRWNMLDFDDSNWIDLPLPMASYNHSSGPFASLQYNSYWYNEYNCYLMRRVFNIDELTPNATYILHCIHDDNMVVYVNGQEVINIEGWTETPNNCTWETAYQEFVIPASAFRTGENVLAVYIQQNWGGAYFDCDLRVKKSATSAVAGDVNGDGTVTSADVTCVYNYLLNGDETFIDTCDVNGDGAVTSADVTFIYNILLGN